VLLHRIRLTYEALADGLTGGGVLRDLLGRLGAPLNGVRVNSSASLARS